MVVKFNFFYTIHPCTYNFCFIRIKKNDIISFNTYLLFHVIYRQKFCQSRGLLNAFTCMLFLLNLYEAILCFSADKSTFKLYVLTCKLIEINTKFIKLTISWNNLERRPSTAGRKHRKRLKRRQSLLT